MTIGGIEIGTFDPISGALGCLGGAVGRWGMGKGGVGCGGRGACQGDGERVVACDARSTTARLSQTGASQGGGSDRTPFFGATGTIGCDGLPPRRFRP